MHPILFIASAAQQPYVPAAEGPHDEIVVTASLAPIDEAEKPASVTIFDAARIEALGATFAVDYIRLAPGASVSVSGSQGGQAQLRIRGAEANHTLLFVDGIAINDLAAGNEPRFETIAADGLSRIELIRGPQSALWGSEALGGVVALESPEPLGSARATASAEYGSRESARASMALASGGDRAGVSATASWSRSSGIDILGKGVGDFDGYENYGGSLRGVVKPAADVEVGAVGRYIRHYVETDGDDENFLRADTAESQVIETYALRGWARYGLAPDAPWSFNVQAQYLDSANRNSDENVRTNDSFGRRTRFGTQAVRRLRAGSSHHDLIAAAEREDEDFATRNLLGGGATDRNLDRSRTALVGEWRATWGDWLVTDVAVRRDDFSQFRNETTFRANAVLNIASGFKLLAGYGEGIAQPSFVDLFGFSVASGFIGNPDLRPEHSRGFEAGLRWSRDTASVEAIAFSNDLRDEIVEDFSQFPNYTVINASGKSRRRGIELSGEWRPTQELSIGANYSFIDTRERGGEGAEALREVRRPRHSVNFFGDWRSGPFTLGGSLAYVGKRKDRDFDLFPAPRVTLDEYVLASARVAYRISEPVEAFARIENALDANYRDLVGYATPGRAVHAGVRLRFDP